MKKLVGLLVACSMALVMFSGTSLHIFASSSETDKVVELSASKNVTYRASFTGEVIPPPTYDYNVGGWKGTLIRGNYAFDGERTIAYYSGTVYCTGNCAMTKDVESE